MRNTQKSLFLKSLFQKARKILRVMAGNIVLKCAHAKRRCFLLITAQIQKWMATVMENLVKMIHGLKMNGNSINRLVKGWVEKNRINGCV